MKTTDIPSPAPISRTTQKAIDELHERYKLGGTAIADTRTPQGTAKYSASAKA